MVSFPRTTITSLALTAVLLLAPAAATAQQGGVNQFFESNAVDNFTVPVVSKDGMGFQFFMDNEAKKKQIEQELLKQQAVEKPPVPAAKEAVPEKVSEDLSNASGIKNAYGDPDKELPVLAQDNAPKPFKGMMAAFEAGDDKLAYDYARQWVRYLGNVQKRTQRVMQAAEAVQAGDHAVSGNSPQGEHLKRLITNDNSELNKTLDPRARQILAQAEADEAALNNPSVPKNDLEQKELKEREVIRRQIAGRVPVDPQGKVDVYVFFAPNDSKGKEFAPIANQIYKRISLMKNAHFATFSTARLNKDALQRERRRLGLSSDMLAGDSFARELKLTSLPAIVFVSPTTSKVLRETADKPFIFYDELISAFQGRK